MPIIQFSGLASGIDSAAIIDATLEARRLTVLPLKNQRDSNEKETTALEEFNTKLLSLRGELNDFMSLTGGAISKTGVSSDSDAVSVTASTGAPSTSTTVSVTSLAKAATHSFNDRFAATDQPVAPGLAGTETIQISVGQGADQQTYTINVDSTTTLGEIAADINTQAEGKIAASTINVGSETNPQYALVLNGLDSGLTKGEMTVTPSAGLTGQGVFAGATIDQAQDAVFTVSGIGQVTRSTNTVSDLLPGITIELRRENTGPVSLSIREDVEKTAEKLVNFVAALNDVIAYSKTGSEIERVESDENATNVFSPLAKTRVDDQALQSIRTAIGNTKSSISGATVAVLADLGITINREGLYDFDTDKFKTSASKEPASAGQILNNLADTLGATNGVIDSYTQYQGIIESAIKSNDTENESINEKLARLERNLATQEVFMRKLFARLESQTSKMNSASSALTGLINSGSGR